MYEEQVNDVLKMHHHFSRQQEISHWNSVVLVVYRNIVNWNPREIIKRISVSSLSSGANDEEGSILADLFLWQVAMMYCKLDEISSCSPRGLTESTPCEKRMKQYLENLASIKENPVEQCGQLLFSTTQSLQSTHRPYRCLEGKIWWDHWHT